jgi:hypothetical protein
MKLIISLNSLVWGAALCVRNKDIATTPELRHLIFYAGFTLICFGIWFFTHEDDHHEA